jgi:hypothetical protein
LIGKGISLASKGLKSAEIGAKTLKGLNAIGLNSQRLTIANATAFNTVAESAAEAYGVQKEIQMYYESMGYDEKEAKKLAGEAAARTFWWNSAALVLPNFVQSNFFHGG